MSEEHNTDEDELKNQSTNSVSRRRFVRSMGAAGSAAVFGGTALADTAKARETIENKNIDVDDVDRENLVGEAKEKYLQIALNNSKVSEIKHRFENERGFRFSSSESNVFKFTHSKNTGQKETDYYATLSFDDPDSETESIFILWTTYGEYPPVGYVFYEKLKSLNKLTAVKHDAYIYNNGSLDKKQYEHRESDTIEEIPASSIGTESVTPQMICTPMISCTGHIDYMTLLGTILTSAVAAASECSR